MGLLPDPARVEAFVADANPDKRAVLVRELLGDRVAYAERWLTFWNDLLRTVPQLSHEHWYKNWGQTLLSETFS